MPLEEGPALAEERQEPSRSCAQTLARYTAAVTPLSAVLIAQNEEAKIADALASVAFCDEIVVVDSGSVDRTREIAEGAGARVIVNTPWPGFVAQRNFAVDAARHDWILALDADERITPALREEIEALRREGFVARRLSHPARGLLPGPLDPRARTGIPTADPALRPPARTLGGRPSSTSPCGCAATVGRLRCDMEHHPYDDVSAHMRKIDRYTTLWARQAHEAGRRTGAARAGAVARLGLPAELRAQGRRPARARGAHGLGDELLLHVHQAREARRAGAGTMAPADEGAPRRRRPRAGAGGRTRCSSPPGAWPPAATTVAVACRSGGALEARLREAGIETHPVAFRGDLSPLAALALARG